jgi:hypothetical protein
MDVFAFTLWTGAIAVIGACIALAIISVRIRLPLLGAMTAIPVAVALLLRSVGLEVAAPYPALAAIATVGLFLLGVTAGSPLTIFVLSLSEPNSVREGPHGGILPVERPQPSLPLQASQPSQPSPSTRAQLIGDEPIEVLRGGATIGYLERIALLGCLLAGHVEGIAIIVAIKGLGRFNELVSPEARERFIIGTLVSLIWAGATGALILLIQ